MTARPLVGVICCLSEVGGQPAQAVYQRYLESLIRYADVDAVLVPSMPGYQDARSVLRRLDGMVLTGSASNVVPQRYGHDIADPPGPFDPERDETAMALIENAIETAKPLFAICRGFQEVNVAFGGTLQRDLGNAARTLSHHAPPEADYDGLFAHSHAVRLMPDGLLARGFGTSEIVVNSVHYQGIDRLGRGLTIEAEAPDGVIEAVRATDTPAPLVAVQWHPEWAPETDANSRRFFQILGMAMRGQRI